MIQPRGKKGKKIEGKEKEGAVGKFSVLELLLQTRAALWGEQSIPAAHSPCAPSGARAGEPHSFNQSQMLSLFLHFKGRAQHKAEHATCSLSPTLIFLSFFFASLPQKHRPRHCQPQRSFAGQGEAEGLLVLWLGALPVLIYSPVQNFASS